MIRKCKVCGTEFEVSNYNKVYCSKECYKIGNRQKNRDYYKNNREKMREYQREYHHKYYYKNREKIKEQNHNYYLTHKALKSKQERICKICGKPFKPTCNRQVYCSKECARKANNERSKHYYRENLEKKHIYHRKYYQDHQEEIKARCRNYYKKNQFKYRANLCCAKHGGIDNCPYEDCICD